MKLLLVVLYIWSTCAVSVHRQADQCGSNCKLENDCACVSSTSPISKESTPQLVTLTFDDSGSSTNYQQYYSRLLFNRKNPDGKPITATFYIPHQYTDYVVVNQLYNKGYDIGCHSITKNPVEYWRNATTEQLIQEFDGNRKIIAKYANIPIEGILGARTPHLELAGDTTFTAYKESGLVYDSSFVTLSNNPIFPFTLEYYSVLKSLVGVTPIESYPNQWVLPIINIKGENNIECNSLFGCQKQGSAEEIKNWLVEQFHRTYSANRAPITYLINSVWFQVVENSLEGFELFLDYLGTNKDVFLVSHSEVLAWSRTPIPINEYKTNQQEKSQSCQGISCHLIFDETAEERIMNSCVPCPTKYPWLGNVNGN